MTTVGGDGQVSPDVAFEVQPRYGVCGVVAGLGALGEQQGWMNRETI